MSFLPTAKNRRKKSRGPLDYLRIDRAIAKRERKSRLRAKPK